MNWNGKLDGYSFGRDSFFVENLDFTFPLLLDTPGRRWFFFSLFFFSVMSYYANDRHERGTKKKIYIIWGYG